MVILTTVFAILVAFIPAFAWFFFFLKEDIHPEPRRLLTYTFGLGALASVPVLGFQIVYQGVASAASANPAVFIVGFALIEEIFKFLAAYFAVRRDPAFDEPIDAMIYMVVAALGFATVENVFIAGDAISALRAGESFLSSSGLFSTLILRFVGATLLHALASGLVGYYWARGRALLRPAPVAGRDAGAVGGPLVFGLAIATAVHAVFNYLVYTFQATNILYPSLFLVFAAFFVLSDFERLKRAR